MGEALKVLLSNATAIREARQKIRYLAASTQLPGRTPNKKLEETLVDYDVRAAGYSD